MKRIKVGLSVIALVIGAMGSAFIPKPHSASKVNLFWYKYNSSNNTLSNQLGTGQISKATAETDALCNNNGTTECAYGYSSAQTLHQAPPAGFSDTFKTN